MSKSNFIKFGILILLIIGTLSCKNNKKNVQTWSTSPVSKNDISNIVTCTGSLEPITEVEVGTQVSGIVTKLYVDYNTVVKKGQLLAELDQTVLKSTLSSAQSSMSSAKSELDYQQKNYERYKTLFEKQLISSSDYESAQYSYEKARDSYKVAQNSYQTALTNLGYAKIYSPIDGIVLSRDIEEGQTVAASFSTPTLFTIANDLTKMRVIANVDEADIGSVNKGQRVTFTVDAYPNDVFDGDVTEVRQSATTSNNVVTYEVVINAPNPDLKLKPGLTATVSIYTLERNDVLTVPTAALSYTPENQKAEADSGKNVVWVLGKDNKVSAKQIVIGAQSGEITEVVSGLSEGEKVVTGTTTASTAAAPAGNESSSDSSSNSESSSPFMPKPPKH